MEPLIDFLKHFVRKGDVLVCGHSVDVQLASMRGMKDGWLDGEGRAPELAHLERAAALLGPFVKATGCTPYLYPTPEGGVRAEWPGLKWNVSLEVVKESVRAFVCETGAFGRPRVGWSLEFERR